MITFENSYCIPKTEEEWNMLPDRSLWCRNENAVFGLIDFEEQKVKNKTEITVRQFLDLIEDKITPWRLDDIWFGREYGFSDTYVMKLRIIFYIHVLFTGEKVKVLLLGHEIRVKTFTELLTLIHFLQ